MESFGIFVEAVHLLMSGSEAAQYVCIV